MYPFIFQVDSWISTLASIGTFISAIVALFTIYQVKKQRQASYQPDIYLDFVRPSALFIADFNQDKRKRIYCMWEQTPPIEMRGLVHTLENIGSGAAKDIRIVWEFDFAKAGEIIKKIITDTSLSFDNNRFCPTLKKGETELYAHPWMGEDEDVLVTTYDFVLPRKDEKFSMSPPIPQQVIEYYALYFLIKFNLLTTDSFQGLIHEEFKNFEPLHCNITYKDIGGEKYKKRFKVSLSLSLSAYYHEPVNLLELDTLRFNLYNEANTI